MNKINIQNIKKYTPILHILIWIILFSIPYLLSYDNAEINSKMFLHTWITLTCYGIIFYINYLILVNTFLFKGKQAVFILINILLVIIVSVIMFQLKMNFNEMPPPDFEKIESLHKIKLPPKRLFIYIDALSLFIPIILSVSLKISEKWRKEQLSKKENENLIIESELRYLKHQLQPHFFFNTINNIYSLIDIEPQTAKTSLHGLSKLMRYLLYNTSEKEVFLKDELFFLTNYIELMKIRVSEKVRVKVDFQQINESSKIAPLLFISLVENSFKHGIDATKPSNIEITLKIENNDLVFSVINTCFKSYETQKNGIGIENLKKKLNLLYPDKHTFISQRLEDEYFSDLIIHNYE